VHFAICWCEYLEDGSHFGVLTATALQASTKHCRQPVRRESQCISRYAEPAPGGRIALRRARLLQPFSPYKALPIFCALSVSVHFATCGASTRKTDRTSECSLLQPLSPYKAFADLLRNECLSAFRDLRCQYPEDRIALRSARCYSPSARTKHLPICLCVEFLSAFRDLRFQHPKDRSHFQVLTAAAS